MFTTSPHALGLEDMRDFDDLRVNIFHPKRTATVVRYYSQSAFQAVILVKSSRALTIFFKITLPNARVNITRVSYTT